MSLSGKKQNRADPTATLKNAIGATVRTVSGERELEVPSLPIGHF